MTAEPILIRLTTTGSIGTVWLNNPPVNALSVQTLESLASSIHALDSDPEVATIVICGAGATFGLLGVQLGLVPGVGGTVRLRRLVGPRHAKDLIYSGRMGACGRGSRWA